MWKYKKKTGLQVKEGGLWQILPHSPQQEPILPTPWFGAWSFQNCEAISLSCLSPHSMVRRVSRPRKLRHCWRCWSPLPCFFTFSVVLVAFKKNQCLYLPIIYYLCSPVEMNPSQGILVLISEVASVPDVGLDHSRHSINICWVLNELMKKLTFIHWI